MAGIGRRLFSGGRVSTIRGEIGVAVLRVVAGLSMAVAHGVKKIPPSDGFVAVVAEMGFPIPVAFAWSAGLAELVGGVLLAIGLLTRPAAFFVLVTMAVAFFVGHAGDTFAQKELALLYGGVAFMFLMLGGGRLSTDALVR